ncbi:hypothetical protein MPSEU_000088200 [Mayamaea pseudoterrestris]|nr:hypothetical protein MPSEU_000088200 [Mayamaea pseudoterrestris]
MKTILLLLSLFFTSAAAFGPSLFGVRTQASSTVCFAKHANDKAAKWAASKRPKKSNLSDRNHKPTEYALHSMVKPAEYNISDAPAEPVTKKEI